MSCSRLFQCWDVLASQRSTLYSHFYMVTLSNIDMLIVYACNHMTLAFISIDLDMNTNTSFSLTIWS